MNKLKQAERGKILFSRRPTNICRRNDGVRNHHSAAITVITDSAKNQQLMLKLVSWSYMRNWIFP